ncbi:MAG: flagellar hook protein FlgE, partial [Zetaproteobacteria bacterium]
VNVTRSNIANQVGNGVRIGAITRDMSQGSIQNTTNPTDMAINGKGLFALRDPASGQVYYSRAGSFFLDKDFRLINGQGFVVQGWATDEQGNAIGNITDITFANLASQAKATTNVLVGVSLDANAQPMPAVPFDPANPTTYHYKAEVNVFDSLGQQHAVSIMFTKVGQDAAGNSVWDYHLVVDGADLAGGTAGVPTEIGAPTASTVTGGVVTAYGTQTLVFGPNGELVQEYAPTATVNWVNAAAGSITFDFGHAVNVDAQGTTGSGLDGTVQMAGSFATRQMTRDGYAAGFLDRLETDSTGRIFGVFTNGQRRPLFQVALAHFPNDAVLAHVGNNLMQETIASGTPVFEKPGNGGMGSITPYALEQSNVDLANEFVKMIVIQRGYEANSKTILTTDQMLSALMQIKR